MIVFTDEGLIASETNGPRGIVAVGMGIVIRQLFNGKHSFLIADDGTVACMDFQMQFANRKAQEITKLFAATGNDFIIQYSKGIGIATDEDEIINGRVVLLSEVINDCNITVLAVHNHIFTKFGNKSYAMDIPNFKSYKLDPSTSTCGPTSARLTLVKIEGTTVVIMYFTIANNAEHKVMPVYEQEMSRPRLFTCGSILIIYDSGKIYQIDKENEGELVQVEGDYVSCYSSITNDCIVGIRRNDPKYAIIRSDIVHGITARPKI